LDEAAVIIVEKHPWVNTFATEMIEVKKALVERCTDDRALESKQKVEHTF
jgi:hypothetical protein